MIDPLFEPLSVQGIHRFYNVIYIKTEHIYSLHLFRGGTCRFGSKKAELDFSFLLQMLFCVGQVACSEIAS